MYWTDLRGDRGQQNNCVEFYPSQRLLGLSRRNAWKDLPETTRKVPNLCLPISECSVFRSVTSSCHDEDARRWRTVLRKKSHLKCLRVVLILLLAFSEQFLLCQSVSMNEKEQKIMWRTPSQPSGNVIPCNTLNMKNLPLFLQQHFWSVRMINLYIETQWLFNHANGVWCSTDWESEMNDLKCQWLPHLTKATYSSSNL